MADINYGITMKVEKGFLSNSLNVLNVAATMNQTGMRSVVSTLGTVATSISTVGLSAVGLCFLRNLATSAAATAQIGISAGGSFAGFATLRAGEPAIFRMTPGVEYEAIGTAGTRLRVDITEG